MRQRRGKLVLPASDPDSVSVVIDEDASGDEPPGRDENQTG